MRNGRQGGLAIATRPDITGRVVQVVDDACRSIEHHRFTVQQASDDIRPSPRARGAWQSPWTGRIWPGRLVELFGRCWHHAASLFKGVARGCSRHARAYAPAGSTDLHPALVDAPPCAEERCAAQGPVAWRGSGQPSMRRAADVASCVAASGPPACVITRDRACRPRSEGDVGPADRTARPPDAALDAARRGVSRFPRPTSEASWTVREP